MKLSSLGQRITYYRQKAGISQKALAALIGMSPNAICLYENDKRDPPLATLVAIAHALKITSDALLGLEPLESATAKSEEYSCVRIFRRFNDVGRNRALELLTVMADAPIYAAPEERQPAAVKPPKKKASKRRNRA
jgi:transcriptional regulator with XRE-family HTH domain